MTLPNWGDPRFWERVWDDLRPRFVLVRLEVGRRRLRWGVPLWPFEETLRFGLLALPWFAYAWQWAPRAWRQELAREGRRARFVIEPPVRVPWPALEALLDGHGEGLLRLPSGEPFVQIIARDREDAVRIEITQV
jgi:hypothetical protein